MCVLTTFRFRFGSTIYTPYSLFVDYFLHFKPASPGIKQRYNKNVNSSTYLLVWSCRRFVILNDAKYVKTLSLSHPLSVSVSVTLLTVYVYVMCAMCSFYMYRNVRLEIQYTVLTTVGTVCVCSSTCALLHAMLSNLCRMCLSIIDHCLCILDW